MNEVTGINEERLNGLILEIGTYQDEISNLFTSLEDSVNNLSTSYVCSAGRAYSNKFNAVKNNFPIIMKNLETYAEDLIRAKDNTARITTDTVNVVQTGMSRLSEVTRNIKL